MTDTVSRFARGSNNVRRRANATQQRRTATARVITAKFVWNVNSMAHASLKWCKRAEQSRSSVGLGARTNHRRSFRKREFGALRIEAHEMAPAAAERSQGRQLVPKWV